MVSALGDTAAPDGVEAALWRELTAELARVISARGADKLVTAPPLGWRNVVSDLHIEAGESGEFILAWTYVSTGDYDQNSEVGVSDLTPIGVNFAATPALVTWGAAQIADGDSNGLVGVSDITPIGQNFLARTLRYYIYASADMADYPEGEDDPNGEAARLVGAVEFDMGTPDLGGRPVFRVVIDSPAAGDYYWVRPSDGETDGARSNVTSVATRGDWWMLNREPTHHGLSPAFGPRSNNVAWTYAAGEGCYSAPAVRSDGWVYFGSNDDSLHAVNADGEGEWTFPTGGNVGSAPAIGADGTVYFGSWDGNLYAVHPDGTLRWSLPSLESEAFFSPAIGADGRIFAGSNDGNLYAVQPDMTVDWTFPTGDAIHACPAIGVDGAVYIGSFDGNVYAVNGDGSERWSFAAGDQVRGHVALGADGTVYAGSMNGHLYAISPAGEELWRYEVPSSIWDGPAIGPDGAIYFGGNGIFLYALNPNGSLRWCHRTRWGLNSSPILGADGLIYYTDDDYGVAAVNQDGSLQWLYEGTNLFGFGLALGGDGTLFCCSEDGNLYAFGGGPAGTPAALGYFDPFEGAEGEQLTLEVPVTGTPPFTFTWDFGEAALPATSTGPSPTVTLQAPGIYTASVSADNEFGDANTQEFEIYVHSAEPPASGWIHSWGGYEEEDFSNIVVDSNGHIHLVGDSYSFSDDDRDLILLEYDAEGNLLSSRIWNMEGRDFVYDAVIDGADNIYIAGSHVIDYNESGFLMKLNASGEVAWARSWDYSANDTLHGVSVFSSGEIVASGLVSVDATSSYGALMMWCDQAGVMQSALVWDSEDDDIFCDVAAGGNDWAYATGYVENYDEEWCDLLIFRIDDAGAIDWTRTFTTADFEEWWVRVSVDDAGDAYLATHSPVIAKYNPLGERQWAHTWVGSYYTGTGAVGIVGDSLVIGAGVRYEHNFNAALFLGNLDGEVEWGREYLASFDDDYIHDIVGEELGRVLVCGSGISRLGTWSDLPVVTATVAGTSADAPGASLDITSSCTAIDLTGEFVSVVGTEDTGGGMEDLVLYNLNLSE